MPKFYVNYRKFQVMRASTLILPSPIAVENIHNCISWLANTIYFNKSTFSGSNRSLWGLKSLRIDALRLCLMYLFLYCSHISYGLDALIHIQASHTSRNVFTLSVQLWHSSRSINARIERSSCRAHLHYKTVLVAEQTMFMGCQKVNTCVWVCVRINEAVAMCCLMDRFKEHTLVHENIDVEKKLNAHKESNS